MSDMGLYASIYEQLRSFADRFDRALAVLRGKEGDAAKTARIDLVSLLREISERETEKPRAKLLAMVLRQELPPNMGDSLELCQSLIASLEKRQPSEDELAKLEQIASTIDHECSSTWARMRGRA